MTLWVGPNGPIQCTIIMKIHNWHRGVMGLNLNAHEVPEEILSRGVLLQVEK